MRTGPKIMREHTIQKEEGQIPEYSIPNPHSQEPQLNLVFISLFYYVAMYFLNSVLQGRAVPLQCNWGGP